MTTPTRTYKGFTIYQRGFLGGPNGKLKDMDKSLVYDNTLADIQWRRAVELMSQNAYSPNVVNIYSELQRSNFVATDVTFLRAVIKTAKEAFGTRSFIEWLLIQYESPDTGAEHIDFLEDMLSYLLIGTSSKPKYSMPVWLTVLNYPTLHGNETYPAKETRGMLNSYARYHGPGIDDFINAMVLKRGGLEQLVRTLYVLFGDISGINH